MTLDRAAVPVVPVEFGGRRNTMASLNAAQLLVLVEIV